MWPFRKKQICACGRPLHYPNAESRAAVEEMIRATGPMIHVQVNGSRYVVPKHYIALHGLDETAEAIEKGLFPEEKGENPRA